MKLYFSLEIIFDIDKAIFLMNYCFSQIKMYNCILSI
jgi:hypothetical protein